MKDFHPDKEVTIVHAGNKLLNDTYPDKYRDKVEKDLRNRKVELVLGDYVDNLDQTGPVVTRSGKELDADLIVSTYTWFLSEQRKLRTASRSRRLVDVQQPSSSLRWAATFSTSAARFA